MGRCSKYRYICLYSKYIHDGILGVEHLLGIRCLPSSNALGHSNIVLIPRAKGTNTCLGIGGGATNLHTEHDIKLLVL